MSLILKGENLKKEFRSSEKYSILKGISIAIHQGETIAIMGPSGVGKSTLLDIVGTLEKPTEGTLELAGKNALCAHAHT